MDRKGRLTVVIADDQPEVLEIVRRLLEPEFHVVRAVLDGEELVEAVEEEHPEVVVTDISMPKLSGMEVLGKLAEKGQTPPTVLLTAHNDPQLVEQALGRGARGYVIKRRAPLDLKMAVEAAAEGQTFISQGLKAPRSRRPGKPRKQ